MYWGVIDPEGGRPTNNILLQGRLKICYQFIDLLVYKSGASNHEGLQDRVRLDDLLVQALHGALVEGEVLKHDLAVASNFGASTSVTASALRTAHSQVYLNTEQMVQDSVAANRRRDFSLDPAPPLRTQTNTYHPPNSLPLWFIRVSPTEESIPIEGDRS